MPELPDITVYCEALRSRIERQTLRDVRLRAPFLLRTVEPPIESLIGREVREIRRLGKRIALGFDHGAWLIMHLMIAGRLHWKPPSASIASKAALAALDFDSGTLLLTEAGAKRRASFHVVASEADLAHHNPGGLEVLEASVDEFSVRLRQRNHTVKRALCDPTLFSGVGNAYSDEILHRARLSPLKLTQSLSEEEINVLHRATQEVMLEWIERLRQEARKGFPEKVAAFRPEMAVHGKFGQPCPVCGAPVQRIRYADRETNYCARCQCEGRLLADRSLSRLLKEDWPKRLEDLE